MPAKTILVIDSRSSLFEQLSNNPQLESFRCLYKPDLSQIGIQALDQSPDIVLINAMVTGLDRVSMIYQLMQLFPEARLLVYGQSIDHAELRTMLKLGIAGFILENELVEGPSHLLISISSGYQVFSMSISLPALFS